MKCYACDGEATGGDFCLVHLKAYENIVEKYACWRKALKTSWREYLNAIEQNPLTGEWVKEVTIYLIDNEETTNAKKS